MILRQKEHVEGESRRRNASNNVDERVKVRTHYFLHPEERLSEGEINVQIVKKALEESEGSSLSDIVSKVVKEFAFNVAKIDLGQFVELFRKNKLPDLIAEKFIQSLATLDNSVATNDTLDEEVRARVFDEIIFAIRKFLSTGGLLSSETLYDLLKQKKAEYPEISISSIFKQEFELERQDGTFYVTDLKAVLSAQIDDELPKIAENAYRDKFYSDKRGFVMGFFMGKVLRYDSQTGKVQFSEKDFLSLMRYIDSLGHNIARIDNETLYDWIFEESRSMVRYIAHKKIETERLGIRTNVDAVLTDSSPEALDTESESSGEVDFLDPSFDVQKFYEERVMPPVFKYYSKKIRKLKKVREVDILRGLNNPSNDISSNFTVDLVKYLQVLDNTNKANPDDFIYKIRELFGLNDSPLIKSLSHKEVLAYISDYLDFAREKMETVRKEALLFRNNDAELLAACDYPDEIKGCKSLATLISWVLRPEDFLKMHPQYTDWNAMMVRSACGTMIRDFLEVTKQLSSHHYGALLQRREWSEKRMRKSLNVKILNNALPVDFRLMKPVDDKSGKVMVVFDQKNLGEFSGKLPRDFSARLMDEPALKQVEYNDVKYNLFPIERKMFVRAQITIPVMIYDKKEKVFKKNRKPRTMEVLIYIGGDSSSVNQDLIHSKTGISMVMSQGRGKELSDESRWLLCFTNQDDEDAFKDFMYADNARNIIKADDVREGRKMSTKNGKDARTDSSKTFKENQAFSIAKTISYPRRNDSGKLEMVEAILETQAQGLESLLATNLSHYSDTSHDIYKAQRSWPILFSRYFPPEYFGDKYKRFKSSGYKGG